MSSIFISAVGPRVYQGTKPQDFDIVPRLDRGGFDGWYGGKIEFRETVEQVQAFFWKKYGRVGVVREPKYVDFTIVYREDRKEFDGWYDGKREAARKSLEKVNAFFAKKYGKTGALINPRAVPAP